MDPCFETATRLARAIRNGRLSSVEATEAHLERIARLNGPLNALVVVDHDGAMKAARAADRALARPRPARRPPGSGRCTACPSPSRKRSTSRGLHHLQPPAAQAQRRPHGCQPGRPAARGRRGDPGQDQCAELCADFQTDSPLFGTTKNAWDLRRTAGGSTGGGAVAVAARLSPLELSSDIGGWLRDPRYNGIR